ncbi:MAG: potassium channel protein [Bryobacteraceae bacterium]
MRRVRRRLLRIAIAIALTLAMGTVGFTVVEHWPLFDSFYMTLITITTVGYEEIHPLSQGGRIFNSFLILFGVSTMFFAIGGMTQIIIELELNQYFGKRRIRAMIENLSNHYIVCGYGRVGRGAATALRSAGVSFVIIDRNDDKVERAIHDGMLGVQADANSDDTLRDVGIMRAAGLIATLSTDADNLFLVISARTLNPELKISARIAEITSSDKFRRAGAEYVFAPYDITGNRMAEALIRPHVYQFLDFTTRPGELGLNVSLDQVPVSVTSELVGQSLRHLQLRRDLGIIVLAIRKPDGNMLFNPPAEAEICGGDCLIVMGAQDALRNLNRSLAETK